MKHLASLSVCPHLWRSIPCHLSELRLDFVLPGGQSFRWKEHRPGYWTGVLHERVWTLTQKDGHLWYTVYPCPETTDSEFEKEVRRRPLKRKLPHTVSDTKQEKDTIKQENEVVSGDFVSPSADCKKDSEILQNYFQLQVRLDELYNQWGKSDKHFLKVAKEFPADDTEAKLRDLGFGYRAKFVSESARAILQKQGPDWLDSLRLAPYEEAKSALCALPGVGAKVADCVCLMALDKSEAVPVDTHVWQIAKRDYLPQLGQGNKTLTERVYREIGDYFHSLWGPYAGWAQGVLFCSDLKKFQSAADQPKVKAKKKLKG
ncbi:N-glycosylase/DNA lyase isoform X3 [Ranitomeya variabilis]|uniref:N-glycosylase/DNA lyase isoform X3 n=1 Tax=Ranitomeya variabilis TaxID=490064 RepID=UPI004055B3E4